MVDPIRVASKVAASGLTAQAQRLLVVSQNLANAQSTGATPGADPYTRQTISFASQIDDMTKAQLVKVDNIDTDPRAFRIEYDPNHPAADAEGNVKLPNVEMLVELADMREANRSYEANLQIIKRARSMISMTIDLLRSS